MTGAPDAGPGSGPGVTTWTTGRIITSDRPTPDQVRLRMLVEDRQPHSPGQHYVIRLRAPDDYTAQRSYSIASDDDDPLVEFLVERLPDGEVSEFLADVAEVGDVLELRGPIGRWFRWDTRSPAICLVGGTGVVPAVAMLRSAQRLASTDRLGVLAVGRDPGSLPYAAELTSAGATIAYTRHADDDRGAGPVTRAEVTAAIDALASAPEVAFVCGSSRFVEYAVPLLVESGIDATVIRVEQFGATG